MGSGSLSASPSRLLNCCVTGWRKKGLGERGWVTAESCRRDQRRAQGPRLAGRWPGPGPPGTAVPSSLRPPACFRHGACDAVGLAASSLQTWAVIRAVVSDALSSLISDTGPKTVQDLWREREDRVKLLTDVLGSPTVPSPAQPGTLPSSSPDVLGPPVCPLLGSQAIT